MWRNESALAAHRQIGCYTISQDRTNFGARNKKNVRERVERWENGSAAGKIEIQHFFSSSGDGKVTKTEFVKALRSVECQRKAPSSVVSGMLSGVEIASSRINRDRVKLASSACEICAVWRHTASHRSILNSIGVDLILCSGFFLLHPPPATLSLFFCGEQSICAKKRVFPQSMHFPRAFPLPCALDAAAST